MPRPVGINHIALEVGDVAEALAFWESIFGPLELRSPIGSTAFIDMGDQFIALVAGRSQARDQARHFGSSSTTWRPCAPAWVSSVSASSGNAGSTSTTLREI